MLKKSLSDVEHSATGWDESYIQSQLGRKSAPKGAPLDRPKI